MLGEENRTNLLSNRIKNPKFFGKGKCAFNIKSYGLYFTILMLLASSTLISLIM
jgi:hypothetical protein